MRISIPTLNLSKLTLYKDNIYFRLLEDQKVSDFINEPIYRYIGLDSFCEILSGKFNVNPRNKFSDKREHGDLHNPFCSHLTCVSESRNEKTDKDLKNRVEKERITRKLTRYWLTSCFTKRKDNFFFWKAYSDGKYGVCIETTVNDILKAIACENYYICIGDMEYLNERPCYDLNEYAFTKYKAYSSERERRVYFMPRQPTELLEGNDPDIYNPHAIKFDITAHIFIKRISLSPFLNGIANKYLIDFLMNTAPWLNQKIDKSKILEL